MTNKAKIIQAVILLNTLDQNKLYEIVLNSLMESPAKTLKIIGSCTGGAVVKVSVTNSSTPIETHWTSTELAKVVAAAGKIEPDGYFAKIAAIKEARNIKGLGLADAKYTVERMAEMGLFN